MAIDLGPFQELKSISFPQGDIFGYISFKGGPTVGARTDPLAAPAGCSFLPTQTDFSSGYTFVSVTILVGSAFENSPSNPFAPELSTSPGTIDDLKSKRATHVDSGESFALSDVAPRIALCQRQTALTLSSTDATVAGNNYPPIARTEYWQFAHNPSEIGTSTESWGATWWWNDYLGWPSVSNRCRFFTNGSLNDKITFT